MKTIILALTAVLLGATIATAQTPAPIGQKDVTQPNTNAPIAAPAATPAASVKPTPAPLVATPANASECKPVIFTRPDVGSQKKFTVTFKDTDAAPIKACNPDAEIDTTKAGTRIVVTYSDNGATINVPTSMLSGNVTTGRCVNDKEGDPKDVVLYKATWDSGVPPQVALASVARPFFDYDKLFAACQALSKDHKFH